jgi:uncharacterized protein YndB with AHSA1/START domain
MSDFTIEAKAATQIVIARHFDADVETVLQAFLEPDKLMQWMGSPDMPMTEAGLDARPGGAFRYVWQSADGQTVTLTGTFLEMEVTENGDRRIVHSELFDPDWTEGATLVRTDYRGLAGGMQVETEITYASTAARDAALDSDMGATMRDAYLRLDTMLAAG